jgi:hypothetical protein
MRALALLLLVGCAGQQKATDDLMEHVRGYQEGLRWRRWDEAAVHIEPDKREIFLDEHDQLDDELLIDDYEIERVKMERGRKAAKVLIRYSWHLDSVGLVNESLVEQMWHQRGKLWLVVAERMKHGKRLPLLMEEEKPDPVLEKKKRARVIVRPLGERR